MKNLLKYGVLGSSKFCPLEFVRPSLMERGGAYEFSISATAESLNSSLKMQLFTVFTLSALWLPASMIRGEKNKKG